MTRILGIDPGSRHTGYGIVEVERGVSRFVTCGRISTAQGEMPERLAEIDAELSAIVAQHEPEEAAFEQVFVSRNARTALVLGQARGVALCAAARRGLPIAEYAPTQVKMALTGSGRADKEQVQHMVRLLLKLDQTLAADASDALAVALTHAQVRATRLRTGVPVTANWRGRR